MLSSTSRFYGALLGLLLAGCATPPAVIPAAGDYRGMQDYLDWYIPRQMAKHDVPGLSIALVDGSRPVWAKGYGYADAERAIPADAETVYQVGSVSKILTAVAALGLVERGHIDLDKPITQYLPEFAIQSRWPAASPITPRMLLSHHAGLPTFHLKGFFSHRPLSRLPEELRTEYLAYPPGTTLSYSNIGTNLTGLAIERVSGREFATYMRDEVFRPLAMTRSGFTLDDAIAAKLAHGYIKGQPAPPTPVRDVPAAGLYSNALDMSRFMRFVLTGTGAQTPPLNPATRRAMFTPQYAENPFHFGQDTGLGWFLGGLAIDGAGTVAWHNGGTKAYHAQMVLLPEKQLGVAVLANADSAKDLIYEVAEEALRAALLARDGIAPAPPSAPRPAVTLAPEVLQKYVGDYSLMGTLARVALDGERLKFQVLDHELDLVPLSATEFRVEKSLLGLVSIAIPFPPLEFASVGGREFVLLRDRTVAVAEKVPPHELPAAWRARVGDYRLVNPDAEYLVNLEHCRLLVEGDRLLLDLEISGIDDRRVKIVVMPYSDDEAYVFGYGRNVGDTTVAYREGGRQRIRYSGFIFERQEEAASDALAAR
ncbi:MAG: beta-lactamase family protein [Gammaproteobacteria bacterium]|nr:beta-lactamase family protein [Gammaproteobacteria bacterium]